MKNIKITFRSLKYNAKLNAINIFCLSLGFTSSIIIIGFVYQEFNYDIQIVNSDNIFRLVTSSEDDGLTSFGSLAQSIFVDYAEIEDVARVSFYYGCLALSVGENRINEHTTIFADPNFFKLFSFSLIEGSVANCLAEPHSIVLSEKASKKYFGKENPMGKQIIIGNDREFTVSGVYQDFPVNSNFQGDIILPLNQISKMTQVWIEPSWDHPSDIHTFISISQNTNQSELAGKIRNYLSKYVKDDPQPLHMQSIKEIHVSNRFAWDSTTQVNTNYLYVLLLVAAIVLVISSANFLLLYIGSATRRAVNIGMRKVSGASNLLLFKEQLLEILVFISISGIGGLLMFYVYNNILTAHTSFLPSVYLIDFKLIILLIIIFAAISFLTAVYPAYLLSSLKPVSIFKTNKKTMFGKTRLVNLLVVGQFVLTIILLSGTILIYKQIAFLEKHDPGFVKDELITIPLNMHIGSGIYNEKYDVFAEELKKLSGIKNVTLAFSSPTNISTSADDFYWEGKPENKKVAIQWNSVFFDYFETLGLKMIHGRSFNRNFPGDVVDKGRGAFILNQKAVEVMGIEDPIGKEFQAYSGKGPIVGIVQNFNFKSLHSEITPMYFDMNPFYLNEIVVRINPTNKTVLADIVKVWKKFVPNYPIEFNYISDDLEKLYGAEQNLAVILNIFTIVAMVIACMGLLALTFLAVQNRTKEIGIRKVNGAKTFEILTMLNKDFIKLVLIAFVVASPIAYYAMNKWLENFAYKTEMSWWIFALAGGITLIIALATVSWQSWRAANRNPVEALRYE